MKKLALMVALIGLICIPTLASATTISYPTTTPVASTTLTDWEHTLAFQKFDASLGTLTQVELYLSSGMDTIITVTNNSPSSSSGHAKTEVFLSVQDSGGLILDAPQIDKPFPGGLGFSYSLAAYPGPGNSTISPLYSVSASSDSFYTDAPLLAEFTGSGNILLNANSNTYSVISYTGGVAEASQVTHAGLDGTVTYTYTPAPIPVPSTVLLLGSGLVGLGLLRRRWNLKK